MLDYVYGHDQIIADFVAQMIPSCRERGFGPNVKAIGIVEDGKLIGGMVYKNYDPDAGVIEMSGAALPGKHWTRESVQRVYGYPFDQLGCQMVVMVVEDGNRRLLRQLAALNYSFIRIPRLHGRDKDAVVCLLTREDWLANSFNQRLRRLKPSLDEAA